MRRAAAAPPALSALFLFFPLSLFLPFLIPRRICPLAGFVITKGPQFFCKIVRDAPREHATPLPPFPSSSSLFLGSLPVFHAFCSPPVLSYRSRTLIARICARSSTRPPPSFPVSLFSPKYKKKQLSFPIIRHRQNISCFNCPEFKRSRFRHEPATLQARLTPRGIIIDRKSSSPFTARHRREDFLASQALPFFHGTFNHFFFNFSYFYGFLIRSFVVDFFKIQKIAFLFLFHL